MILGADSAIDPVAGNDQIMWAEILFALDMGIELKVDAKAPRSLRKNLKKFEAGKAEADRGAGVIRDSQVHERVISELKQFVDVQPELNWRGLTESPLLGPAGNKEFLTHIEKVR